MSTLLIRDADVDDATRIAEIHVHAWQRAYAGLMPASILDRLSVQERTALWRARLEKAQAMMLVCTSVHEVCGWLACGPSRDDDAGESVGEIYGLYVDPISWRSGVGTLLWQTASTRLAMRFGCATLWVLDGNTSARQFYERIGFRLDASKDKTIELEGVRLLERRYTQGF